MHADNFIWEDRSDKGLLVNITSSCSSKSISLEIAVPTQDDKLSVAIFVDDKSRFLKSLREAANECLLRIKDEEQTGERDDG